MEYMEYVKKETQRVNVNLPMEVIEKLDEYVKRNDIRSRKRLIEILVIKECNKL